MHKHTCTTEAAVICKPCEALTDAWVIEHGDPAAVLAFFDRGDHDALRSGSVRSPLTIDDVADMIYASAATDPQAAYATDTDSMRAALRLAAKSLPVVADVLAQTRRTGETPSRVRADMRATVEAVRGALPVADPDETPRTRCGFTGGAYAVAAEMAAEGLPVVTKGSRWMPAAAPDARTYAGPVVARSTDGSVSVYTVRLHTVRRLMVGPLAQGETERPTITARWTTREDHPTHAADLALSTGSVFSDWGTAYRPDASTVDAGWGTADRWAAAQEPMAAVRKPSSRKRRRDGALGGPAVITHR